MEDIKSLRKKQFIYVNILIAIFYSIFLYFVLIQNAYVHNVSGAVGVFVLISSMLQFASIDKDIHFFDWMRRLQEHERQKLGPEWKKVRKTNAIATLFLSIMLMLQFLLSLPAREHVQSFDNVDLAPFFLFLILFLMIVVNVGLYMNMRKIDQKSTEELAGFTKKEFLFGLFVGIVLAVIVFIGILTTAGILF